MQHFTDVMCGSTGLHQLGITVMRCCRAWPNAASVALDISGTEKSTLLSEALQIAVASWGQDAVNWVAALVTAQLWAPPYWIPTVAARLFPLPWESQVDGERTLSQESYYRLFSVTLTVPNFVLTARAAVVLLPRVARSAPELLLPAVEASSAALAKCGPALRWVGERISNLEPTKAVVLWSLCEAAGISGAIPVALPATGLWPAAFAITALQPKADAVFTTTQLLSVALAAPNAGHVSALVAPTLVCLRRTDQELLPTVSEWLDLLCSPRLLQSPVSSRAVAWVLKELVGPMMTEHGGLVLDKEPVMLVPTDESLVRLAFMAVHTSANKNEFVTTAAVELWHELLTPTSAASVAWCAAVVLGAISPVLGVATALRTLLLGAIRLIPRNRRRSLVVAEAILAPLAPQDQELVAAVFK
jgi:hypothetical protein